MTASAAAAAPAAAEPATQGSPLFAELSHLAVLEFAGADSAAFLHGQLTCDVTALPAGGACFGGYCSPKGRLLATFWLVRGPDALLMLLARSIAEITASRLRMYVLRSKVAIRDATRDWTLFGIAGGDAAGQAVAAASGDAALAIDVPVNRRLLLAPVQTASGLREKLASLLAPATGADWEALDVDAGMPLITEATRDKLVPQMVNLDLIGGVSFTKGCYPGQEVVARSHYLGKVKRRMYLAALAAAEPPPAAGDAPPAAGDAPPAAGDAPPAAGDELFSDDLGSQASGLVVSARPAAGGGYRLLAVAQASSRDQSTVRLRSPGGPPLRFHDLPYAVE